jgi:hypothetical protein
LDDARACDLGDGWAINEKVFHEESTFAPGERTAATEANDLFLLGFYIGLDPDDAILCRAVRAHERCGC